MRGRLLDATVECLCSLGYSRMSTNDVVKRARRPDICRWRCAPQPRSGAGIAENGAVSGRRVDEEQGMTETSRPNGYVIPHRNVRSRRIKFSYPTGTLDRHYVKGDLVMSHIVAV